MPQWTASALQYIELETDATISTVVIDDTASESRGASAVLSRLASLREWAPFAAATSLRSTPEYAASVPIEAVPALEGVTRTYCEPTATDGFGQELPPAGVAALASVDVAVRFGFGILVGDALDAPTHGVLSFHHGDLTEYRGQPAGFWEFVHDEPTAGITVQRLDEALDAGEIFAYDEVDVADADTWREVRRRLYTTSEPLLAEAVSAVLDGETPREPDELGDLYTLPRGWPVLEYARKTVRGYV